MIDHIKKLKTIHLLLTACATLCVMLIPAQAGAGTHAHFAAFFDNGEHAGMTFPATVNGDDIEAPLLKIGAEMMLFTHSVNILDGDVLNLQNDTLREVDGGFKDFGLNCTISINTKGVWSINGLCKSFTSGKDKNSHQIKGIQVPKTLVWYKVFEDKQQGTAGYFMKENGEDFGK